MRGAESAQHLLDQQENATILEIEGALRRTSSAPLLSIARREHTLRPARPTGEADSDAKAKAWIDRLEANEVERVTDRRTWAEVTADGAFLRGLPKA
jgi:hypothetical protein